MPFSLDVLVDRKFSVGTRRMVRQTLHPNQDRRVGSLWRGERTRSPDWSLTCVAALQPRVFRRGVEIFMTAPNVRARARERNEFLERLPEFKNIIPSPHPIPLTIHREHFSPGEFRLRERPGKFSFHVTYIRKVNFDVRLAGLRSQLFLSRCGFTVLLIWKGCGGVVARLLASRMCEPSSFPTAVAPGFPHVRIVPDDATGRRVSSGISRFPHSCVPALLHTRLTPPSSALKSSLKWPGAWVGNTHNGVQSSSRKRFIKKLSNVSESNLTVKRYEGNIARLALRSDEALEARVRLCPNSPEVHTCAYLSPEVTSSDTGLSAARIAPSLLDLGLSPLRLRVWTSTWRERRGGQAVKDNPPPPPRPPRERAVVAWKMGRDRSRWKAGHMDGDLASGHRAPPSGRTPVCGRPIKGSPSASRRGKYCRLGDAPPRSLGVDTLAGGTTDRGYSISFPIGDTGSSLAMCYSRTHKTCDTPVLLCPPCQHSERPSPPAEHLAYTRVHQTQDFFPPSPPPSSRLPTMLNCPGQRRNSVATLRSDTSKGDRNPPGLLQLAVNHYHQVTKRPTQNNRSQTRTCYWDNQSSACPTELSMALVGWKSRPLEPLPFCSGGGREKAAFRRTMSLHSNGR
ncbi:hypothetical protein PR048_006050 [Dryococelus australis]|uniref:Uncharacterized protein n=1 Tax=Dryococelus australis TaxID=614101 RepID=A0ABQ9IAG6_9NEOP|nr:hypothetical protein PR048_006050 [Dryococelus australis]